MDTTRATEAFEGEGKEAEEEGSTMTSFDGAHHSIEVVDSASTITAAKAFRGLGKRRRKDDDDDNYNVDGTSHLSYKPKPYVMNMHETPRFGHSNRLGKLTSSDPMDPIDYARGLKSFSVLILSCFIIWSAVLLAFKFIYGLRRVGCAAGGEVLDMIALSKNGHRRKSRKRRLIRSWRVQTTFCITAILIPTCSYMMMEMGWQNVNSAWTEVQSIVDDVESLAFKGWNVLNNLQSAKRDLLQNGLVIQATANTDENNQTQQQSNNTNIFAKWCPNSVNTNNTFYLLQQAMDEVHSSSQEISNAFEYYVPDTSQGFEIITKLTDQVDESISWFFSHDWIWKLLLMIINVLTVIMLLAVYCLTKRDIIHEPSQKYLSWFILPLFILFTIIFLITTISSGVATLVNADFCSGGPGPPDSQSPQGTIEDAILSFHYGSLERKPLSDGRLQLVYDSFIYFSNGCLTENPLLFFDNLAAKIKHIYAYLTDLTLSIPLGDDGNNQTIMMLNQECGADISFLPTMLHDLQYQVGRVQNSIDDLVELSSCYQISPLVRRLTHGALCDESAYGLTWIYSSSIVICVLCFVLLTTRAALFNPVKPMKKRAKKPKRIVEKEFNDYKEFMSEFYKDTDQWKMEPDGWKKKAISGENQIVFDFGSQIEMNPTFETQITAKLTQDELDQLSNGADMNRLLFADEEDDDESSCDGSSYESLSDDESENSDDGDNDHGGDDDDDSQSALTSFFSETKSIAMQSVDKIRNMASLLRTTAKNRLLGNHDDEEESAEGDEVGMFLPNLSKIQTSVDDMNDEQQQEKEEDGDYDYEGDEDSIDDESLYTTSPTAASAEAANNDEKKENIEEDSSSDDVEEDENDGLMRTMQTTPTQNRRVPLYGNSRVFSSILTPMAPKKAMFALARTKAAQIELEGEMQPLTGTDTTTSTSPTRERASFSSPGGGLDSVLNPRQLRLSPVASPTRRHPHHEQNAATSSSPRGVARMSPSSQRGATSPSGRRRQPQRPRQRIWSEDSDDMSLYVDDNNKNNESETMQPPGPPQKAFRGHRRTRGGR